MNVSQISPNGQGHPFVVPKYTTPYNFENEDFDYTGWHSWMRSSFPLSVSIVSCYLLVIFIGRQWMENRQPYKLKGALVVWNFSLAVFSATAFLRSVPEIIHLMRKPGGFHESVCSRDEMNIITVFWALWMTLSKVAELGDTIFIVLRKQPLIILHWFHHATVLLYSFYTYADHDAAHRWYMTINAFIHSVMYSYYALKALRFKLPRSFAMAITFTQLVQMFFGIGVNVYTLYVKSSGVPCQTEPFNVILALTMYASYAVLFANFFYQSYFSGKKKFA